ncbi:hypothetical protein V1L54_03865 [Streptomyces sp. TRM 70361]|uniref:hypothetical protein n=1 Tax=Streptomyces sp. TRM 70361 TaxID=3116553 RepID=UPI002E7C01BA|nr:hypothetical protein [Streptomyces sp. TRM 70361]MEE1938555.1 hypothetical protein [Streptomyces sp. TRM 70361]
MSAISLVLLLTAGAATAVSGAALYAVRGLRRAVDSLCEQLLASAAPHGAPDGTALPAPRTSPSQAEIRSAVAAALAEERERELAEARAFWAAQEARDTCTENMPAETHGTEYGTGAGHRADDRPAGHGAGGAADDGAEPLDALLERALGNAHESGPPIPHQLDREGIERGAEPRLGSRRSADPETPGTGGTDADTARDGAADSPELAAARRRHPSNPGFGLDGEPAGPPVPAGPGGCETTRRCLAGLADARTPLTDVRSGPLGTLDVYVFADGTTVCLAPGHREAAERLGTALREGAEPVLLGGSGVFGAYTLTFACGEEHVYVLADRVITSF